MQEIPRAILLPPPSPPLQRPSARVARNDADAAPEVSGNARRRQQGGPHATFLTLVELRREDTVEIKGKQFRFRPYGSRGAASDAGPREPGLGEADAASDTPGGGDIAVDILDGFGTGAQQRNSSAFIASLIAQERPRQSLYNPRHEAASDAYRRAGGSPSAVDNQPRVISFAV